MAPSRRGAWGGGVREVGRGFPLAHLAGDPVCREKIGQSMTTEFRVFDWHKKHLACLINVDPIRDADSRLFAVTCGSNKRRVRHGMVTPSP